MDVLKIIRQKAVRPIKSSKIISQTPFKFVVNFEDGYLVEYKDSPGLRMWAVITQNSYFEPILGDTNHCTKLPVYFFDLLGFRIGDAVSMQNQQGIETPILFS